MDSFRPTFPPSPASSLRPVVFATNPASFIAKSVDGPQASSSSSSWRRPIQDPISHLPPSPPTSPDDPLFPRTPANAFATVEQPFVHSSLGLSCSMGSPSAGKLGHELDLLQDEWHPPSTTDDLDVNDRQQMGHFMKLGCSREACQMAAEVVGIIIPALPKRAGYSSAQRTQAAANQERRIVRYLAFWTDLSPHPLCVLISTVILLERLALLYPAMATLPSFSDTPLRVLFSAFLISLKWTCDVSHMNASFVRYTSWTVHDIGRMEREMLECLRWDVYVSAEELLHRAAGFYSAHLSSDARLSGADDGLPDLGTSLVGNLFLMQPRSGVEERSWKHGLVKAPGEGGSRIPSSPEQSIFGDDVSHKSASHSRMRGVSAPVNSGVGAGLGGGKPCKGGEPTVWRRGRLERRGSEGYDSSSSRSDSQGTKMERRTSV